MASQCHTTERNGVSPSTTTDPVLAAARAAILDLGLRRTTVAEIARRAGMSRMTVYRQHGDLDAIVSRLLTDELTAELLRVQAAVGTQPNARACAAETTARTVAAIATHPLLLRVLDVDPEVLLPLIVDRVGSTQRQALAVLEGLLREGQRDGSIRPLDPALAASVIGATAQSFVFSHRVLARTHPAAELHRELALLVDAYLAPRDPVGTR